MGSPYLTGGEGCVCGGGGGRGRGGGRLETDQSKRGASPFISREHCLSTLYLSQI